jgi:hypothetical protein
MAINVVKEWLRPTNNAIEDLSVKSLIKKYTPVIIQLRGAMGRKGGRTKAKRIVKMIRDAEGKEDALRFYRRSVIDITLFAK